MKRRLPPQREVRLVLGCFFLLIATAFFALSWRQQQWPSEGTKEERLVTATEGLEQRVAELELKLNQIEQDSKDLRPMWAMLRTLEHGVQKALGDFTPMWPVPPEGCKKFPRQLPLRPYNEYIREQMLFGPMKKMALIADKRRVIDLVKSFKCPSLHFINQIGAWDVGNISTFDLAKLQTRSYVLKANFGAGMDVFVKNGIITRMHAFELGGPQLEEFTKHIGQPASNVVLRPYLSWLLHEEYRQCQEPHYAFIDKLIVAEEFRTSTADSSALPEDIKIFASMGKLIVTQIHAGRDSLHTVRHVDQNFRPMDRFVNLDGAAKMSDELFKKLRPREATWNSMMEVAKCISRKIYEWGGLRFSRIDLYDLDGQATFGEITLTPMGGAQYFSEDISREITNMFPYI